MAKNKSYTAEDIEVLSDQDHVRLRTQIYLGNMKPAQYVVPLFNKGLEIKTAQFIPAVYKAVGEILDNCVDEFAQHRPSNPTLTLIADSRNGKYCIGDNGRGVPVEKHATGKYTPEVVFGELRSGRNFKSDKAAGVQGMNGVGSAVTNFCSTSFEIDITRDGKKYHQQFQMGGEIVGKPKISKTAATKTGTQITFALDPLVFGDVCIPQELMNSRAIEIAFNNPGVTVEVKNGGTTVKHKYKNGLEDVVKTISSNYFKFESGGMEFYVIFDAYKGAEELIFTWVNSSLMFDGGLCNTQFLNAFFDNVLESLAPRAKKAKCEIAKNDIRHDLLILGTVKVKDPEYDSQSKTRMTGPNLRSDIQSMIKDNWTSFARKNKVWLDDIYAHATEKDDKKAAKKAVSDLEKLSKTKIPGLLDATNKDRSKCKILICEGKSAASSICEVRDPHTIASFPLTGKINNVWNEKASVVLEMGKIKNLLAAIGLIPGKKANKEFIRYGGGIVISTDADFDGDDIFTLLCNMLFKFWPDLFDPKQKPIVFRLVAPNVVVSKGKQRIHFTTMESFRAVESKYSGWTVEYMKGLGSMTTTDWDMILNGESDCFIPIQDVDGKMKDTMELLFGPSADARKEWLTT